MDHIGFPFALTLHNLEASGKVAKQLEKNGQATDQDIAKETNLSLEAVSKIREFLNALKSVNMHNILVETPFSQLFDWCTNVEYVHPIVEKISGLIKTAEDLIADEKETNPSNEKEILRRIENFTEKASIIIDKKLVLVRNSEIKLSLFRLIEQKKAEIKKEEAEMESLSSSAIKEILVKDVLSEILKHWTKFNQEKMMQNWLNSAQDLFESVFSRYPDIFKKYYDKLKENFNYDNVEEDFKNSQSMEDIRARMTLSFIENENHFLIEAEMSHFRLIQYWCEEDYKQYLIFCRKINFIQHWVNEKAMIEREAIRTQAFDLKKKMDIIHNQLLDLDVEFLNRAKEFKRCAKCGTYISEGDLIKYFDNNMKCEKCSSPNLSGAEW